MGWLKRGKWSDWVSERTDYLILKALDEARESGGLRFTELLRKTKLSRDAVSRHLKDLFKDGSIYHDYLTKRYSISQGGSKKLHKYEMENALRSVKYSYTLPSIDPKSVKTTSHAKFVSVGDMLIAINEFVTELVKGLRSAGILLPSFEKEDYEILKKCIAFSIHSDKPIKEEELQHHKKIPRKLLFIFEFDGDKFKDLKKK